MDPVRPSLADSAPEEQMTPESLKPESVEPAASDMTLSNGAEDAWESVDLPGTVLDSEVNSVDATALKATSVTESAGFEAGREKELLTLIHDLNDCNDVLLARVSHLESALDESHGTLHSERTAAKAAQNKTIEQAREQVSAQQNSAQQMAQTAQQQVASVVAQLEAAEQGLQRQQLINETLLAELGNAQERVAQLEHDCALSAQQHAEEAQVRVKAETTIRDLRSRLQRQQRYTLQFKAALEKSLTVTARSANTRSSQPTLHPTAQPISSSGFAASPFASVTDSQTSAQTAGGVTMPKAQRIMPWAGSATAAFEGIDPHLESLIRGASQPSGSPENSSWPAELVHAADDLVVETPTEISAEEISAETVNGDAESQLWRDLERVVEHPPEADALKPKSEPLNADLETADLDTLDAETVDSNDLSSSTVSAVPIDATTDANHELAPAVAEAEPGVGPKFNWQQPDADAATSASTALEKTVSDIPSVVIDPYTVPAGQQPAEEVTLTEPSPWGAPPKPAVAASDTKGENIADDDRSLDSSSDSPFKNEELGISPAVNPLLRTQKKVGSLASVQLPTFETAKAGSFKR
ncbi:MAG: hypothetical protein AAFO84_02520 [Cyanobacteria bacterium J06598_1]